MCTCVYVYICMYVSTITAYCTVMLSYRERHGAQHHTCTVWGNTLLFQHSLDVYNIYVHLCSGRHKQEESLFEEMLQVSQAIVSIANVI